ncbi:MAG TPA: glycoside hydrolase family 30 beta sandwich domain-containing protein [Polyangia bacterium]|nr:glycoside hydrolase family 30 beta sandwich domain-containing protein [Polyangia bacterium]
MSPRKFAPIRRSAPSLVVVVAATLLAACSAGSGDGDNSGTGGSGAGGTASGGSPGTGGEGAGAGGTSSGGTPGTGGGSGGSGAGTGGKGTGGSGPATGGNSGSGGTASGSGGAGGMKGTGGVAGTGGAPATGGSAGGGGHPTGGAAGSASTGGASGTGGTAGTPGSGTCGGGAAQSSDVTINESNLQQRITGFGVSSAWAGSYANASDPDYLWSTTTGAGLSLLRIRYGDGLAIAKAAVNAGVTVWLTPWGTGTNGSPGGSDTTTETANGCKSSVPVLTNPQDWANTLAAYVQSAKSQGVPLYAVSAENEPDSCGINQTTSYSATQLATWMGSYLGPAMAPLGVKVMGPETQNACGFTSYFSAIQSNAAAWSSVGILASHEYGCGTLPAESSITAANKEYWETEVDTGAASGDSPGDGIASALLTVTAMHNDLTKANLNAWHYWWMYCSNSSGCLYDTGTKVWTKRLWAMGNFSRFVRPGWKRVGTSGTTPSGVLVSAYINPANNALSIVAINSNASSKDVSFYISGAAPCSLTPYETSAGKNLGQGAAVSVSQSRVTVTLNAQSVTTLVGTP